MFRENHREELQTHTKCDISIIRNLLHERSI